MQNLQRGQEEEERREDVKINKREDIKTEPGCSEPSGRGSTFRHARTPALTPQSVAVCVCVWVDGGARPILIAS